MEIAKTSLSFKWVGQTYIDGKKVCIQIRIQIHKTKCYDMEMDLHSMHNKNSRWTSQKCILV